MTVTEGFMLGFTLAITISTGLLWWQTKQSHEFTLFLHFLEFIKEAKGLGGEPGEKIRQRIMDQVYHPRTGKTATIANLNLQSKIFF